MNESLEHRGAIVTLDVFVVKKIGEEMSRKTNQAAISSKNKFPKRQAFITFKKIFLAIPAVDSCAVDSSTIGCSQ